MQGPTHAISGTVGGLFLGEVPALFGAPLTVPQQLGMATVVTGAALLPDVDLPTSTIAATGGHDGTQLATDINQLAARVYRRTGTHADLRRRDHGHRTLTHTLAFAVSAGAITGLACWIGGPLIMVVLVLALAAAAQRALLGPARLRGLSRLLVPATCALATLWFLPHLIPGGTAGGRAALFGAAVTVGCLLHLLFDWPTDSGVPLLWPWLRKGRRWYRFGLGRRALRTGSVLELPIFLGLLGLVLFQLSAVG